MSLTEPSKAYRPFHYPWAYKFWEDQQNIHWLPKEIQLSDDIKEFKAMDPVKRAIVTKTFRTFVQSDIKVHECYHKIFMQHFKPIEVQMMLTAFSNMETIHIAAYSHLLDSLGLPESEYTAFMEYTEMKDRLDLIGAFDPQNPTEVALALASVSAFGEGLQLFASFAVLLNFPRQNLLKGMGQIVSWSVRDESLHCDGIMRLYHSWLAEHPEIDRAYLTKHIREMAHRVVAVEDKYVDLVYAEGEMPGMTVEGLKKYIRFMANFRLRGLGEPDAFDVFTNPFPWVNQLATGIEHANFFERQATEYSKAATAGDWGDVF